MTECRVLFGSPIVWGSRGREFDSRHSDQRWLLRSEGASNPKGFGTFLFLRLQTRQRLFQTVGDGALAAYVQMAVDVCGHLDVRVSQPLLHVLQTVALRQQHAGAGRETGCGAGRTFSAACGRCGSHSRGSRDARPPR